MGVIMSLLQLFFGFKGRIGRLQFWMAGLVQFVAFVSLVWFTVVNVFMSGQLSQMTAAALFLLLGLVVLIWSGSAIYTKRLHDRNKGAIWLLAVYVPAMLPTVAFSMGDSAPISPTLASILSIISTLWILIELGCLRGTDGPNRFDTTPTGFDPDRSRQLWPDAPAPQSSRSAPSSSMSAAFAAIEAAARNQSQPAPSNSRYPTPHYAGQAQPTFGQRKPGTFGTKR